MCSCGSTVLLLCAEGTQGGKQFIVDGSGIIQEGSNDTLDTFNVVGWEYRFGVGFPCQLCCSAIVDEDMGMRGCWRLLGCQWLYYGQEDLYITLH